MSSSLTKEARIWQWAFFCFVLAGLTGFVYRLGFILPFPFEVNLENVRHAHSHLMFFGWASLLPLFIIAAESVPGYHIAFGARLMKYSLWVILISGLLSFPFFLIWGYHPVPVGDAMLPLSAMLSGIVMIGWYIFMAGYLLTRFKKHHFQSNSWFEVALFMLFICSFGAWGVGVMEFLDVGSSLSSKALTHFFLAVFVEGWLILVLLGLLTKALKLQEDDFVVSPNILIAMIALGAPLTFSYGIPESMVSINISVATRLGGLLMAEGVLLFMISAIKKAGKGSIWLWPILFMIAKASMQFIASVTPVDLWLSDHGARILYLHVLLLGGFTTGILFYLGDQIDLKPSTMKIMGIAVVLLLMSLLLLTGVWPAMLSGMWIYTALAVTAIIPTLAFICFWMEVNKKLHQQ